MLNFVKNKKNILLIIFILLDLFAVVNIVYAKQDFLRVLLLGNVKDDSGAEAKFVPVFQHILKGTFYDVYGNSPLGIVGKIQLPLDTIRALGLWQRFSEQSTYDKGLEIAQKRLGGMAALAVELKDVRFNKEGESEQCDRLIVQINYFDKEDILSNRLQDLISERSMEEVKSLIDKYIEFIKES